MANKELLTAISERLSLLSNQELSVIAQDYNDRVGNELKNALNETIAEYERGIISHLSLLKQTEGICADFKNSLIDANLFGEYVE